MFSALPLSAKPHAPDQASSPSRANPLLDRAAAGAPEGGFAALMKRESLARDLAGARSRLGSAAPALVNAPSPAARQPGPHTAPPAPAQAQVASPSEQARPLNEASRANQRESADSSTSSDQASSGVSKPAADQSADGADVAEQEGGAYGPQTKDAAESGNSPGSTPSKTGRKPGQAAHGQSPGLASASAARQNPAESPDDALSDHDGDRALQEASALDATADATAAGLAAAWSPAQALAEQSGPSSLATTQAMAAQGSGATALAANAASLAAQASANGGQRGSAGLGTAAPAVGALRTGTAGSGQRSGLGTERHERGLPHSEDTGLSTANQAVGAPSAALQTAGMQTTTQAMVAASADGGAGGQHDLGSAASALPMQGLNLEAQTKSAAETLATREAVVGGVPSAPPGMAQTAAAATAPQRQVAEVRLPVPLHDPGFGSALGAQISLLARGGLHEARLQLNPAEMGPITVQIALDGAAARVHFQADLAATREVIEASLPALAGALRESGLTLAGGGVSQQHQQQPGRQPGSENAGSATGHAQADLGDDGSGLASARPLAHSRGLVDLIA